MTDALALVAWLTEQLNLDEAHATKDLHLVERASGRGAWTVYYGYNLPASELRDEHEVEVGRLTSTFGRRLADGESDQHVYDAMLVGRLVRSAKSRAEQALREVAAKRKLLDLHVNVGSETLPACQVCDVGYGSCGCVSWDEWPCATLKLLAEPYEDRAGYLDAWRPS